MTTWDNAEEAEELRDEYGDIVECGEHLMEGDWAEGFTCTLPIQHNGPHRCASNCEGRNVGIDIAGRHYEWVHEWVWGDE